MSFRRGVPCAVLMAFPSLLPVSDQGPLEPRDSKSKATVVCPFGVCVCVCVCARAFGFRIESCSAGASDEFRGWSHASIADRGLCLLVQDEQLQENKEAPAKESELTFKNYDEQMVRELRELCRARGLPSNGTKAELKAALAKDDEERRPVEAKAASVKDAEPEAAVQAGVPVRQRRIWLQQEGNPYSVFLGVDAIVDDLRHLATPDVSDRQRANVKLLKSDGTELDLDGKVPLDAGSSSKSPVRIEGAPSSEFQAGGLLRFAFRAVHCFCFLGSCSPCSIPAWSSCVFVRSNRFCFLGSCSPLSKDSARR